MFSSADLGAALLVSLPKKFGEVYANIVNGPGYSASENDRFKDVAARLTLTPFANSSSLGALAKSVSISPWIYRGRTASRFQNGGADQIEPVTDGLHRNRHGVFAGLKDPRIAVGGGIGERTETIETGDNTAESPRATSERTGRLLTGFALVRPGAWFKPGTAIAKWGVLGRLDDFTPDTDADARTQLSVVSLFYEPSSRVSFSLDLQRLSRKDGSTVPETKTLFFHVQALF
jgi:hypothetical protein